MKTRPLRVLLMGPPGGGKGTVGKMMQSDFGFAIVSTGDALREAIRSGRPEGEQARDIIKKGGLVPDSVMSGLLRSLLSQHAGQSWILDGYPRTLDQARILDDLLTHDLRLPLDAVFNLNVPNELIIQRISGRYVHPASGRIYNLDFSPPKVAGRDDVTGEPLVRRPDDEPDAVLNRLKIYEASTTPILEFFEKKLGNKLHRLNIETSKEGYAKVKPVLEALAKQKQ